MKVLFNLLLLGGLWGTFTVAAMAQEGEVNPLDTSPIAECLEPATITSGNQDNFCPHSRENAFGCWCQEVICNIAAGHCRPGKFQRCPAVEWHEVFYNEPVALVETSCQAGKTVFADQQWRDQVVDHLSEVPAEALENYQACIDPRASNGVTYREARVWGLVEYEKRRAFFEHQHHLRR